ncbi:MAG: hypothetical protein Q8M53_18450 [Burkholderiales bacterium]|nr:hypothetical protein [Burkholderiales bacterium]
MVAMLPRLGMVLLGLVPALPVVAQLSCEQLVASAQAGLKLRDGGASLGQVLTEIDKSELGKRFRPDELALIRRAVQLTYTGEVSVYELAESCDDGKGRARR